MRIENLRSEKSEKKVKVVATVIWEDCDRPNQDAYIETDEAFAQDLSCDPNAFLIASAIPAMYFGEERVYIDAEICPELRDGLEVAMNWLSLWYYEFNRRIPTIEGKTQYRFINRTKTERAGVFLSGGIDSLGILRHNRLNFQSEHPRSFKDGLVINTGMSSEWFFRKRKDQLDIFQERLISLCEVAEDANLTLIPVYTNIRYLGLNDFLFGYLFAGAILSAVAHAFSKRLTSASIASCDSISDLAFVKKRNLKPLGTHPLLDPNFSSHNLRIHHVGLNLSRLQRAELVACWDSALQNITVCPKNWPGNNCGECEKCIRTMLELLVLGVLHRSRAFPNDDVTEEMISKLEISPPLMKNSYGVEPDYIELIGPLKEIGRYDLVRAIEKLLNRYRLRSKYRWDWNSVKKRLKQNSLYRILGRRSKSSQRG